MFESKKKTLIKVYELEAEVSKLRGIVAVKDAEIAFFKERGDRYFLAIDERNKQSNELLKISQEIMLKIFEKVPGEIAKEKK